MLMMIFPLHSFRKTKAFLSKGVGFCWFVFWCLVGFFKQRVILVSCRVHTWGYFDTSIFTAQLILGILTYVYSWQTINLVLHKGLLASEKLNEKIKKKHATKLNTNYYQQHLKYTSVKRDVQ